jgi:NAD(P)-dependent dehydrogenase (short-subunit alcohol dehydrogenase family)
MSVLVISGASSGLGKEIVDGIIGRFDTVVCLSRTCPEDLKEWEKRALVIWFRVDYSNPFDVEEVLRSISKNSPIGACDVLINNSGYMPLHDDFRDYTLEEELAMVNVNLVSHHLVMKHFIDLAVVQNIKLDIINIASACGVKPDSDTPLYAASKAGIIALTSGMALYRPDLVRVNCISPGFFNTNLVPGEAPQWMLDAFVPQQREAQPSEILPVVNMILDSPFMTGSNIVIDGGQTRT